MFGHKHGNIQNQNYRIETYPSVDQLAEMMQKAKGMSGIKHCYLWENKADFKKYTLTLHCKIGDDEIEWWMHEENVVGNRLVWFHKTKDIAVIYPHIISAVGARMPLKDESEEEKQRREQAEKEKPASLGERLKKTTSKLDVYLPNPTDTVAESGADSASTASMRLMEGNLSTRPISWLLKTAAQSDLTGELKVEGTQGSVIIQFGLGRPVHAAGRSRVGTEAILELFAWKDGSATFTEGKQPEAASVQDSVNEIMKLGNQMLENIGFLHKHHLSEESSLSRPPIGLSEEQLEQRLNDGPDYGFKVQSRFYKALDGRKALRDVGDEIALDKSRLLAVAVNFLKLGLVLTPDGRSLREVGSGTSSAVEAFANAQRQAQSGAQQSLKPPPGFFGTPGGSASPVPEMMGQTAGQNPSSFIPPLGFGGTADTASGAHIMPSPPPAPPPAPPAAPPQLPQQQLKASNQSLPASQTAPAKSTSHQREFFEVGLPKELVSFNASAVASVKEFLIDSQTGIYTAEAFQFLLDREFQRAFRFGSEFSLLAFCVRLGGSTAEVLPIKAFALALESIAQVKREVDILGHLGDRSLGLILPNVNSRQSVALIDRISADLPKLAPSLGGCWPILHFGIADVPHDARDLPSLMDAAQKAMLEAANRKYSRTRFAEMGR